MGSFKERWGIESNGQVAIILFVFAITGSTAAYIAKPILSFIGITRESVPIWLYIPLYLIVLLPFYKVLLLTYGTLFGQRKFFWAFTKKMLSRMGLGFLFKENQ